MRDTRPAREPTYQQLVEQERLILAATELIYELLDSQKVTKSELAERLDRTKGYVTQLLAGDRNLTLRTLADLAGALGHRIEVSAQPVSNASGSAVQVRHRHIADSPWPAASEASGVSFGWREHLIHTWGECHSQQTARYGLWRTVEEGGRSRPPLRVQ